MTAALLFAVLGMSGSQLPPLGHPDRKWTNEHVRRLYDENVRNSPEKLADVLNKLWDAMPDPFKADKQRELAEQLMPFLTIGSPPGSPGQMARESAVGRGTGMPVYSMILNIGVPAVPALLQELLKPDTKEYARHRETAVRAIVEIYDRGGEGRLLAAERIKLYAAPLKDAEKQHILGVLKMNSFLTPIDPNTKK